MAAGLQIWDESGTLMVDTTTAGALLLGEFVTGGANTPQSGSVTEPAFSLGTPFFITIPSSPIDRDGNFVTVSISGNTLTWSYPSTDSSTITTRPITRIIYGIA